MAVGAVSYRQVAPNVFAGRSKLTGGTVTVTNHQVNDNTLIFVSGNDGNVTGILTVTRTSGTSFTITSSVGGDSGFVAVLLYLINDPTD
jgi:hypothetical protein